MPINDNVVSLSNDINVSLSSDITNYITNYMEPVVDWSIDHTNGTRYRSTLITGTGYTNIATTTWNGQITGFPYTTDATKSLFMTEEERLEYRLQEFVEPRDHAFNPGDVFGLPRAGDCRDCSTHNVYRHSAERHLYVIEEEPDWQQLLAG